MSGRNWKKEREWLRKNFGDVTSHWEGPNNFHTSISNLSFTDNKLGVLFKNILRPAYVFSRTPQEGISKLYEMITRHGNDGHIVIGDPQREVRKLQHVKVDPETLNIQPWQPPAAKAA